MLRSVVRLLVVGVIAHAVYGFVPVYVHNCQFTDAVGEAALFSRDRPPYEIVEQVMELAAKYDVPLEAEAVEVSKDRQKTYIALMYEHRIAWLPGFAHAMPFHVAVDGWHVSPDRRRSAALGTFE